MARHVLLYHGKCGRCRDLAAKVVAISAGQMEAVGLDDPQAATWARDAGREVPDRPALVVLSGTSTRLHTGVRMVAALVRLLGVRDSAAVLRALGEDGRPASDSRRALFRAGIAGLGVIAGGALLPGTASAAPPDLTPEQRQRLLSQAAAYDRLDVVQARLRDNGFQTVASDEVVLGTVGDAIVLSFYGSADADPARAAGLARIVEGGRVTDASLEFAGTDRRALLGARPFDVSAVRFAGVSLARAGEMETYGKKEYLACMFTCIGGNCRDRADNCLKIPILNVVLACIVAVCGSQAYSCHKTCKSRW